MPGFGDLLLIVLGLLALAAAGLAIWQALRVAPLSPPESDSNGSNLRPQPKAAAPAEREFAPPRRVPAESAEPVAPRYEEALARSEPRRGRFGFGRSDKPAEAAPPSPSPSPNPVSQSTIPPPPPSVPSPPAAPPSAAAPAQATAAPTPPPQAQAQPTTAPEERPGGGATIRCPYCNAENLAEHRWCRRCHRRMIRPIGAT